MLKQCIFVGSKIIYIMENKVHNTENKSNRFATLLFVGLILLVSVGGNIYQWNSQKNTIVTYDVQIDSLVNTRIEVEKELATASAELEKYRGMSTTLDSLLNDANEQIGVKEKKIRELLTREKNSGALNAQLKKELEALKQLKDEYFDKIDALVAENKVLKEQNQILQDNIGGLKQEKTVLQKKVDQAAMLKAEYFKVAAYKKRNNGSFTESATAKRTNKLELCFTLLDNTVAEQGDRLLYLVITEPTGKVLGSISKTSFNDVYTGEQLLATSSKKITYTGEKQDLCMSFENDKRILTSGTYKFALYIDGMLLGETGYILK
jgi:hypothetical protein